MELAVAVVQVVREELVVMVGLEAREEQEDPALVVGLVVLEQLEQRHRHNLQAQLHRQQHRHQVPEDFPTVGVRLLLVEC